MLFPHPTLSLFCGFKISITLRVLINICTIISYLIGNIYTFSRIMASVYLGLYSLYCRISFDDCVCSSELQSICLADLSELSHFMLKQDVTNDQEVTGCLTTSLYVRWERGRLLIGETLAKTGRAYLWSLVICTVAWFTQNNSFTLFRGTPSGLVDKCLAVRCSALRSGRLIMNPLFFFSLYRHVVFRSVGAPWVHWFLCSQFVYFIIFAFPCFCSCYFLIFFFFGLPELCWNLLFADNLPVCLFTVGF